MKSLSRRELLRWAALAAGSSTIARLPSGVLLADTSANSPLGQMLAAQADEADLERSADRARGGNQRLLQPVSFSKTLLRADDLLSLRFDFINLVRSGNQLVLQDPTISGYVIVRFPPQHIGEQAFLEADS